VEISDRLKRRSEADQLYFANITENEGVQLIKQICEHEILNRLATPDPQLSSDEQLGELRAYRKIIADIEAFQMEKERILKQRREARRSKKEEEELPEEPNPHTGDESL